MMEKHLTKIASMVQAYSTFKEELHQSREKKQQEERELIKRQDIYIKKLRSIRKQLMDYGNTLNPTLGEIGLDIRVESWTQAAHILRPRHGYKDYILFAIAPQEVMLPKRWRYCGFMAILSDFAKDEITFYEYSDEIDRKNNEDTAIKRNEFEKHAWRLVNIPIDYFDFEAVKPFINAYLSKELNYITLHYPSPELLTFDKTRLWNITPQPTTKSVPQPTTESVPQPTAGSGFYPKWNPISAIIKYAKNLFGSAKKK